SQAYFPDFVDKHGIADASCLTAGRWDNPIHSQVLHDLAVVIPGVAQRIHDQAWSRSVLERTRGFGTVRFREPACASIGPDCPGLIIVFNGGDGPMKVSEGALQVLHDLGL